MADPLPPDPYAALGVSKDADLATIKTAYRKLVLKFHPDKVPDESLKAQYQEEFQKVQQAYELLGDEESRARYDELVKLAELRKEMNMPTGSSRPPNPRQTRRNRSDTMEGLRGFLNGRYVVALCDTGADENFIAEDAAKELGLKIVYAWGDDRPSFVMGHGRRIFAIGSIKAWWMFEYANDSDQDVTFYVLKDCIFDVMIGSRFLSKTETMTEHRYRLCRIPKPGRAIRTRVVNLCGTPSRRIRGSLIAEECAALPDSGAEPNLLSYEYAKRRGWLLDIFPGPESCRLLQFADGSTETVDGRLRLQWQFVTGWGIAPPDADDYVDFDVLRGCPFDVILGSDFLDDTDAFINHQDSFQDVIQEGPSGLNIVIWVTDKKKKKEEEKKRKTRMGREIQEEDIYEVKDEVDRELERRAKAEWKANQRKGNQRSRVDELDTEHERRNQWDKAYPGRGYDRHSRYDQDFRDTATRWPSPTRRRPSLTRPSSTLSSSISYDEHRRAARPSRDTISPRSPSTPRGKRTTPIRTTSPPATRRTERTKTPQSRPQARETQNQHGYVDPSRTNLRWTDTPHPSLAHAIDRIRTVKPEVRYTPPTVRSPPRPSSHLFIDELDMRSKNPTQSRTAASPLRSNSSASTRSSRPRSYSDSSSSRAAEESSNTSISEDSIQHPSLQRTQTHTRTSEAIARANQNPMQPLKTTKHIPRINIVSCEDRNSVPLSDSVSASSASTSTGLSFDSKKNNGISDSRLSSETSVEKAKRERRERPRLKKRTTRIEEWV